MYSKRNYLRVHGKKISFWAVNEKFFLFWGLGIDKVNIV